jgi:hypothetical protein
MSAKLVLGNLPAGVTADDIRNRFNCLGAGSDVSLLNRGNPNRLGALIEVDAERHTLQVIVDHCNDIWWKERHISLYVPLSG